MIFTTMPVGPLETNCHIIGDEKSGLCCVIDPGADSERVLAEVKARDLKLTMILLTHGHWDHTGGVAGILAEHPDVPVYIHSEELTATTGSSEYSYAGAGENQRTYGEGDVMELGETKIRVLHTPGHSRGSVVLLCGDVMVAGDTLFAGSCGRCDLFGGDLETMFVSLKRLAALEGDYQVYPGHGPDTTLSRERRTNPYVKHAVSL